MSEVQFTIDDSPKELSTAITVAAQNQLSVEQQDAIQAAKRVVNKKQYREELARQINEAYEAFYESNTDIRKLQLAIENRRILLGSYLLDAKKEITHGKFKKWIQDNCKVPYRTTALYMRFAEIAGKKPLTDIYSMTEYQKILVMMGLREPTRANQVQQLVDFNAAAVFTKTCLTAVQKFKEVFAHLIIDDLDDETREQFRKKLEPFVAYYEALE